MKLVPDVEKMIELRQAVKCKGDFITNFFTEEAKIINWIRSKQFYFLATEEGILFLKKNHSFYHLYFYTSSLTNLYGLVKNHLPTEFIVVDIPGKEVTTKQHVDLFINAGFKLHTQLQRYIRINDNKNNTFQACEEITLATTEDAEVISSMFEKNFDPISEQVPTLIEVNEMIQNKKVLFIKNNDKIKGFLVRTFIGQTTILNHFLVDENFRGEKIGSKLLKHYLFESKNIKRMLLWVIFDNARAINMYLKHGFMKEDMVDYILINK